MAEQNVAVDFSSNNPELLVPEFDFIPDLPEEHDASDFDDYSEYQFEASR